MKKLIFVLGLCLIGTSVSGCITKYDLPIIGDILSVDK